jgi:hypothetical protein
MDGSLGLEEQLRLPDEGVHHSKEPPFFEAFVSNNE